MLSAWLLLATLAAPAPAEEFDEVWTKVRTSIERGFYARDERKEEMDARLAAYEPKALAAKDRAEFSTLVNQMIDEFQDSHFGFYPDWEQGYWMNADFGPGAGPKMPHIGAWFSPAGDGYTMTMVLDGLQAMEAGLREGDVVLTVDGEPFTPVESLRPKVGKEAEFAIRRGEDRLTVKMEVEEDAVIDMFFEASRNSRKVIEHEGMRIGYIRIWLQLEDRFRTLLDTAAREFQESADATIVDLRAGFGGRPEGFGTAFFLPPVDFELESMGQFRGLPMGNDKPMILLIDGGTRSAKEVTSYMFKKSGRATLIGTNTAGDVIGTTPQRLADWAFINVPIADGRVDGIRLEDLGVAPDIEVPNGYNPEGNDLVIQRALAEIAPKVAQYRDRQPAKL